MVTRVPALVARYGWALAAAAVTLTIQAFISRYLFWDSYFGLVAGRYIAANGVPTTEVLTTAGKPEWIDQQWLAHWLFYAAWSLAGYAATALLTASTVALAYGLLAALLIHRGVPGPRAFLWSLLALMVALGSTVVRAQSLVLPLAAILLWLLLDDSDNASFRGRFLLVVPLLIAWSNLHGSVVLGAGSVVAYAAIRAVMAARGREPRSALAYGVTAAISAATLLVTPYGLQIFDYYRSLLANSAVHRFILEWSAPELGNPYSLAFFAVLVITIAVVGYGFARGYRPNPVLLVATVGLGVLALTGVRYAVWFGMVAAVLDADVLSRTRPAPTPFSSAFLRAGAAALLAVTVIATAILLTTSQDEFERDLPREAMTEVGRYAAAHPTATILADELASALIWRDPELAGRVAFDTRLEQYPEDKLVAWFEFLNRIPPAWPAAAEAYDVLLISGVERPGLVTGLASLPGWSLLHAEPNGAAFVRTRPAAARTRQR